MNTHNLYSTPIKPSVNFGKKEPKNTESFENGKSPEEIKAAKLDKIAKAAQSSNSPSSFKSFTIITALMGASALTASALSGRLFNVLNGVGAVKALSTRTTKLIEKAGSSLAKQSIPEQGSKVKTKAIEYSKKGIEYLKDLSDNGVEDQINKLVAKRSRKISAVRREVLKANPEKTYTKKELKELVQEVLQNDVKVKKEIETINNQIKDVKGANLLKKTTRVTAATVTGIGALTEASHDGDNNGVPDCVEYKKANKNATQKVTAAILDCALDSFC